MSILTDLLPQEFKDNSILAIKGLATFYRPRRYINNLCLENSYVIFLRYLYLILLFAVVQTVVFTTSKENTFWILSIKIALFDSVMSLFMFPVFWLPLKLLKHSNPIKVVFGFQYPLRYIFLIPAVICYGLFLSFEEYLFLIPRGIITYALLIALISFFPINSFNRIFQKTVAICLVAIFYIFYIVAIIGLVNKFEPFGSLMEKMGPFYDPIGCEIDEKIAPLLEKTDTAHLPSSFKRAIDIYLKGEPIDGGEKLKLSGELMNELYNSWKIERELFFKQNTELENQILKVTQSSEFETSKKFLISSIEALNQSRKIGYLLDEYEKAPSGEKIKIIAIEYNDLQKMINDRSSKLISHYRTRVMFKKIYFIM